MTDPIVDQVRAIRDTQSARFNHDLDAIFQNIKKQESAQGYHFVEGVSSPDIKTNSTAPIIKAKSA